VIPGSLDSGAVEVFAEVFAELFAATDVVVLIGEFKDVYVPMAAGAEEVVAVFDVIIDFVFFEIVDVCDEGLEFVGFVD